VCLGQVNVRCWQGKKTPFITSRSAHPSGNNGGWVGDGDESGPIDVLRSKGSRRKKSPSMIELVPGGDEERYK